MKLHSKIKGVKMKKQWAVFAPDGYLQYRTISDTQKEAKERTLRKGSDLTWQNYSAKGYRTNKVLVDIKLLP
jgi:hypothetical protein